MEVIQSTSYNIHFDKVSYTVLAEYIKQMDYSSIFIIVDDNTLECCYPKFAKELATDKRIELIQISPGEENKNIETCIGVWNVLTELKADRNSLLITLGGGVVGDLGGFIASTFKRGIDFINIPTSLLAMVDASVGGKTGVDLGNLKNQIGLFSNPKMVIIDPEYLYTLDSREIRSGTAEIIKHSLTHDYALFKEICFNDNVNIIDLIPSSIKIKNNIVLQDPKEKGLRKVLNFGHTIGHAIESYYLNSDEHSNLTHGEAVAIGLICEIYISSQIFNWNKQEMLSIVTAISKIYGKVDFKSTEFDAIYNLLKHDKKNNNGQVNFVLLKGIEDFQIDCTVSKDLIYQSLEFYTQIVH